MDWQALALSLKLASLTTGVSLLIGLPLAYFLSRNSGRWTHLIESFLSLPMVLPPTVLGFYFLLLLGPIHLAFTFTGLLIASVVYSLPFALQPFLASFHAIDPDLIEASWVLGESKWNTMLKIVYPLALPGILSGAILAFAHTLGEFGVVLMVGGNIPGISRTLSVSIYDQVQSLDYSSANQTALFLLGISLLALLTTSYFRKKPVGTR